MLTIDMQYSFDLELKVEDYNSISNDMKGVYFFYDWDDELLYVGLSTEIKKRLYSHIRVPDSYMYPYRNLIRYVKIVECNDSLNMNLLETYLINTLDPPLNMDIKLRKYDNKDIDDKYIHKSDEYNDKWMNEVHSVMVDNDYNKKDKLDKYIKIIESMNINNPVLVSKVSKNFKRYIHNHYEDKKEFIDTYLNNKGYEIIEIKDRYSHNSRYISKFVHLV